MHVYNRALAAIVGMDRWKEEDWIKAESNLMIVKNLKRPENKNNKEKTKRPEKSRDASDGYW